MPEREFTSASFHAYLAEGRLMGARCRGCGRLHVPPRPLCPHCGSTELDWAQSAGEGSLAAFTVVHVAPTAMLAEGYTRDKPYCSGIVALREGPHVSAQLLGADATRPERIQIGAPARVAFIVRGEGACRKTHLGFDLGQDHA